MRETSARLRHLPNVLSALRIAAAPALVVLALVGAERAFTWVLIPALLSDIADGYLARRLGLTSPLGALLDSIADLLLFFVAVVGVWCFHPGLLSSFHTYASKAAA